MNRYTHVAAITGLGLLLLGVPQVSWAQEAEVVSEAHAKGIVVLRASFLGRGELHSFGLEISRDGETFVNAKAGPTRGLRFSDRMVLGSHGTDQTVLVIPIVGRFGLGSEQFLFDEPGTYELRWDITFKDRDVGDLKIEQTVEVGAPTEADLQFLARAGDRDFHAEIFGVDPPERGTRDLLALGIVSLLLQHAQDDPGEEGSVKGELAWADAMMGLARELPESSYAPYAAFFAGRIYFGHLGKALGPRQITPNAKTNEFYRKADEALRFVVKRGDPFIKPRALCSLAFLRVCVGSWVESERFLTEAEKSAGGQGVVDRVVNKMRYDIRRLKDELVGQEQDHPDK